MLNQGVGSWLERRKMKSSHKVAIIYKDRQVTYDDVHLRSKRLASYFRKQGVTHGDRVAFLGENHPAFLETFFAVAQLGAIFVPLNIRLAPPELNHQLIDAGAKSLVVSSSLFTLAQQSLDKTDIQEVIVFPIDQSEALYEITPKESWSVVDYEALLAIEDDVFVDVPVNQSDIAVIMYTSGTTGKPKGAMLTHANLIWNSYNVLVDYDIVSTDVALIISPMFHTASFGMGVLPMILKGATLILEPNFEPGRVLNIIQDHKVTALSGVPTTFQMLSEHPDWESTDISSLQKLTCGGSPAPLRVLEAFEARGLAFTGGYGMTESSPGATSLQAQFSKTKMGSVGLPHFYTDVRIVGEDGVVLPPFSVGEIQVFGPNVFKGYWNLPEATKTSFDLAGWFKSGDLGYLDQEGFLFVSDRLKDMIISGGENIYPAEIEMYLLQHPGVLAAGVVGMADEKWGEVPVAFIIPKKESLDVSELQASLTGVLAKYKVPKRYVLVTHLPQTASGKVIKKDLRELVSQNHLDELVTDLRS
jgi:fatty-acyl-CoA synthase